MVVAVAGEGVGAVVVGSTNSGLREGGQVAVEGGEVADFQVQGWGRVFLLLWGCRVWLVWFVGAHEIAEGDGACVSGGEVLNGAVGLRWSALLVFCRDWTGWGAGNALVTIW